MKNVILVLLVSCVYLGCTEGGDDSIRLIPKGYEGPVLIVFDQKKGEPKEYEGEKRLYRIPTSGVLKTQFEPNYGIQAHSFFYIDSLSKREEIPFVNTQNQDFISRIKDKTKVYAFGESALSAGSGFNPNKGDFTLPHSRVFYIGNLLDINKAYHDKIWFHKDQMEEFRAYENK